MIFDIFYRGIVIDDFTCNDNRRLYQQLYLHLQTDKEKHHDNVSKLPKSLNCETVFNTFIDFNM